MRLPFFLLLIGFFLSPFLIRTDLNAQEVNEEVTYLYLVRHAEKADDGTKDPPLTKKGEKRAQRLADILEGADVSAVYSTNFKRTRDTAFPTAQSIGTEVVIYDPRNKDFLKELSGATKNVLVVGHSNSTPSLVNALLGEEKYQQLDESVYTKLFIICKMGNSLGATTMNFMEE